MLIKCNECEGKVSDKAASCPHCGAPVTPAGDIPPKEERKPENEKRKNIPRNEFEHSDEENSSYIPPPGFDFAAFALRAMKFCFTVLTIGIIVASLCFFALRYDLGGISTRLRAIAEADSGDGSHIDSSNSRMMFKYKLGAFLNAIQGMGESKKTEQPKDPIENAQPLKTEPKTPAEVHPKQERKPLDLPPEPPGE